MIQPFSLIFQVLCDLEGEKYYFTCITRAQQSLPRIEKSCSEDHACGVWLWLLQGLAQLGFIGGCGQRHLRISFLKTNLLGLTQGPGGRCSIEEFSMCNPG